MKSTTLNSALFTDLDDSQSEAVNGGSYCYYEKPKYYCYYEKPKCYTPPVCYTPPKCYYKPKCYSYC
jgi:hypothetical protein